MIPRDDGLGKRGRGDAAPRRALPSVERRWPCPAPPRTFGVHLLWHFIGSGMTQVGSSYPGGPRRDGERERTRAPVSSEERHDRRIEYGRRKKVRKRTKTTVVVIGLSIAGAATMGYMLGDRVQGGGEGTRDGRDDLTPEEFIQSEFNRVLMELWEMESLEAR